MARNFNLGFARRQDRTGALLHFVMPLRNHDPSDHARRHRGRGGGGDASRSLGWGVFFLWHVPSFRVWRLSTIQRNTVLLNSQQTAEKKRLAGGYQSPSPICERFGKMGR
jgi:hypothetical protein